MNISEKIRYGETLIGKGDLNGAISVFKEILIEDKLNYTALNYLGIVYSTLKRYDEAVEMLQKAIQLNPSKPNAYLNLAIILFQKGEKKAALTHYKSAIERDNKNSMLYYNYAVALNEIHNYEEAKTNYEKAVEFKPDNYQAYYNLGLLNLLLGNYESGWKGYEYREKANVVKHRLMAGKRWNGEEITNATLYVYPDQGFGDTIQFVRFLPEIKKRVGKLIFECQPSLFPLLKNISGYDEIVEMNESLKPVKEYDYYLPITSSGKTLNLNEDSDIWEQPYIFTDKKGEKNWSDFFADISERKIGIVWRSNSNYKDEKTRAIPLSALQSLFIMNENKYFSLQMEPTAEELAILKTYDVKDLSIDIKNFNDTANIIEQLDLIISTDTAVPHLAGAMGKPVLLLLTTHPDWRWQLERNNSVWYPSFKLLRQKEDGNWKNIISNIYSRLMNVLDDEINLNRNIFHNEGIARLKKFLINRKEDTYPETPMKMHTDISNQMIIRALDEIALPKNSKILDIGCGQGLALSKFTDLGYNPVGITLNDLDYKICLNKGYKVYQMDQSFLQFENDEFDLLWARHVLEHSIFPYFTLYEYNRVLKNNGFIYIEVPAAGFDAVHENNPNHYSVLTKTMWHSLFDRSGFVPIYEFDLHLTLEKNGKDQYWMFILQKKEDNNNEQ